MENKQRLDFLKVKALIFDKKLREKYNIDREQLGKLLREYAVNYGHVDVEEINHTLSDISDLDNYIKGRQRYEIQKDINGQYHI